MKNYLLLLLFTSIALRSLSQDSFSEQLMKIVGDASNNFTACRGSILKATKVDTTFKSKITLDGTTDNRIETYHWIGADTSLYGRENCTYFALIDSGGVKMGMHLVKQWKRKVANVLGKSFQEDDFFRDMQNQGTIKGFKFTKENIEVSVYKSTFYNSEECLIYLGIYMK